MRKNLLQLLIVCIPFVSAAQVGVNATGNPPHSSAGLDVDFTDKGLLPPRLTTTERDAISGPAEGLQVFNTTTKCLEHYVNGLWQTISCACTLPTITSTSPASRCSTGTVVLGATASAGVINWYDAPSAGNFLSSSNTFTTPSISSTTTYYVEAVNGSCISASRTAVIATVNPYPIVAPITGTASVSIGGTTQLSDATSGGTWSSSNPGVATVNSSTGLVSGVSTGSVLISYSVTADGCTSDVSLLVSVDPCGAAGGKMYGGYCWLPTGVGVSDPEMSCATFCTNLGKTCNSTVMQNIAYPTDADNIVHLFHPGVSMTNSGDAPSYNWVNGTGNHYIEANTCSHNDNAVGRERYCVCTPEP